MGRKRPIELKFRLSRDEYDLLQDKLKKADMNRNAYLVKLLGEATLFPREPLLLLNAEYTALNRQLRGMANNINQLTKLANGSRTVPSAVLLENMQHTVQAMQSELQPLWDETRRILWQS